VWPCDKEGDPHRRGNLSEPSPRVVPRLHTPLNCSYTCRPNHVVSRLGSAQWVNSEAVTNFIVDIAIATNICVDIDEVVTRKLHQRRCNYHSLTMSALTQMQSDM
ncbi:hypothetical protein B296_00057757, partial [Ensete ventricosum]